MLLIGSLCFIGKTTSAQEASSAGQNDTVLLHKTAGKTTQGRLFATDYKTATSAVSSVAGETLYKTVTPNLTNTLYGRLPGLTGLQGSGEPGADDASLGIRGIGSYGYGATGAFKIFVDGFETNQNYFRNLSPTEIESVSVLKDAAALATFGMRGANGVLWVTTKRGTIGKPTVQFQTRTAFQSPISLYKPLNSYDFARLYNQAVSNDNGNVWKPFYTDAQLQAYRNGNGTNVNWYDQVLKKRGAYSDADLVFSGGEPNVRYALVMDYARQGGLYNVGNTDTTSNENYNRYNLRANLDFTMFSIFEAKVDINTRIEQRTLPNYVTSSTPITSLVVNRSDNFTTAPIFGLLAAYPSNIYPIRDPNTGNWSGSAVYPNNPVATITDQGYRSYKNRILQGNFELKEKLDAILPGLYAKEAFSFNSYSVSDYNKTASYARYLNGVKTTTDVSTPITASVLGARQQEDWKQATATLGYDRSFSNNRLMAAVNYHQSDFRGDGFFSTIYRYQNISGRANYSFNNRYVAEFGFSSFGTDAFAPGNRWGFYPSLSAGWIVSNETFLKESKKVNYFKLRASAGKLGYADSDEGSILGGQNGRYLYQQYYASSTAFYTGDAQANGQTGFNPLYIANPGIFAEKSMKYNIGIDLSLFNRLNLTMDAYLDKRSDIVTRDLTIPSAFGNNSISRNLGKMTSKGLEVSAEWAKATSKLTYSITGMASYNKNKVDYRGEVMPLHDYTALTGKAQGTFIGLVANGFYNVDDFNANGTLKSGQPIPAFGAVQPGDIKYKDLDGNGVVDNNDRTAIGKPAYPELTYAFGGNIGYAGFELQVFLQGIAGSAFTILGTQTQAFLNNGNAFPIALDAWAYYPAQGIDTRATAKYPRLTTLANDNNYQTSSFWVKSRAFLRVRNIELSYNVGSNLLRKTGLSKLKLFVGATNPFTWSRLKTDYNLDPETFGGYPALKSFNGGFSLTF